MSTAFMQGVAAKPSFTLSGAPLAIADIFSIGSGKAEFQLSKDPAQLDRINAAVALVEKGVSDGKAIYGVTTGFGGMANVPISREHASKSQHNLLSFLATGAGNAIDRRFVRSAMALRANVLMQGYSGVRLEIIQRLVHFLNADATPVVRELGSIGASGDLVPLSTIARALVGDSQFVHVQIEDQVTDGPTALQKLGLNPISLNPKEGLAIVNGTSFSSAIAAHCIYEARQLFAIALTSQAMMLIALQVQHEPFEDFVHQRKPHPGQVWTAQMMRRLFELHSGPLNGKARTHEPASQIQDRYSLRCLPQYTGPIAESLVRIKEIVETEMNSVSDNPLVDAEAGQFYQSGNFLGQYVGIAMDDLRRNLGLLAKHLDVQIASLVSPAFNNGLPSSLRGNEQVSYNMGLKGLQITANSIMPMLTYLGNPLVEHFPTHAEQFNQNINGLSWGAANFAWKSVELFQHYLAASSIFAVQAMDLRAHAKLGHYDGSELLGPWLKPFYNAVYEAMQIETGKEKPLVFDDSDLWLEEKMAEIHQNISNHDTIVNAVEPIVSSLDEHFTK